VCTVTDIEDAAMEFAATVMEVNHNVKELNLTPAEVNRQLNNGRVVMLAGQTVDIAVSRRKGDAKKLLAISPNQPEVRFRADQVCAYFEEIIPNILTQPIDKVQAQLRILRHAPPVSLTKLFKVSGQTAFNEKAAELQVNVERLRTSPCFACPQSDNHLRDARLRIELKSQFEKLTRDCTDGQQGFQGLLNCHLALLTDLGCIVDGVITLKGRISIEMRTVANELVCAELVIRNFFDALAPADIAALASCVVAERIGNRDEEIDLPDYLQEKVDEMQEVADIVGDAMYQAGVEFDSEKWDSETVNPAGMIATMLWVQGNPFSECLAGASIPPGSLVRLLLQTGQQLSCFAKGAMLMGNKETADKFDQASTMVKRGIIFGASLYLD
jgi:superfamily II RNA helicase